MSAKKNLATTPAPSTSDKVSSAAMRTMRIAHILETETDQNHYLTADEIVDKVKNPDDPTLPAVSAERKSVYRNVDALRAMGFEIDGRRKKGYAQISRRYEPENLRLLMNTVRCSHVLAPGQSRMLGELLAGLASPTQRSQFARRDTRSAMPEIPEAPDVSDFFDALETVQDAIVQGKALSFQLRDYTVHGRAVTRHQAKRHAALPLQVTYSDGHYYVVAMFRDEAHDDTLTRGLIRIDRMLRIDTVERAVVTGEQEDGKEPRFDDQLLSADEVAAGIFHAGDEEEAEVHLSVSQPLVKFVVDRFGKPTKGRCPRFLEPYDEQHAHVVVRVRTGAPFYGWLAGFGGGMRIMEPAEAAEGYARHLTAALDAC